MQQTQKPVSWCFTPFKIDVYQMVNKFQVQASLVIRDLTLRVFAITRFREKKP